MTLKNDHGTAKRSLRIDFAGAPVEKPKGLTDGSVRVPAFIARTGVQVYTYEDGSTVREYRPPEEVFAPFSINSWPGLALTVGHPDEPVTPDNWARLAVGHIADNARKDGTFIAADAIVKDREALKQIGEGALVELSCGYFCEVEMIAGITPAGEPYDGIQRNIIGNHVAIGPAGWGRAGENVKLYAADSATCGRVAFGYLSDHAAQSAELVNPTNTGDEMPQLKKDEITTATGNAAPGTAPQTVAATTEPQTVAATQIAPQTSAQAPARADDSAESFRIRVAAVKADAKHATLAQDASKSNREIMIAVVRDTRPAFNADGRSDDYVRAAFDLACEGGSNAAPSATRDDSNAATVLSSIQGGAPATREDGDSDPIAKAHAKLKADMAAVSSSRKGDK